MPSSNNNDQIASKADAVMRCGRLVRTADHVYFVPQSGAAMALQSREFRRFVAGTCETAPSSRITKLVIAFLDARAHRTTEVVRVVRGIDAVATRDARRHVLVNLGGGQVFELDGSGGRTQIPNGSHGVLFIDPAGFEPVSLTAEQSAWRGEGGDSFLMQLIIDRLPPPAGFLTPRETAALMIATWFTAFMTGLVRGKPVVLLLGAAGVGKSVTQRLLAKAFYGPCGNTTGGVGGDRMLKDLFAGAAYKPVIFRDDVNRMAAGAIDSLCQMATGMTLEMAEFNKTLALSTFDVFAFLVLSAFKPTWLGRVDLMSRIIPIDFARGAPAALTESQRMNDVLLHRRWMWAETLLVLAAAQRRPKPTSSPTRFDDWYGEIHRVMQEYSLDAEFDSALGKLAAERIRIICGSNVEIAAIHALAKSPGWGREWWRVAHLADALATNDGTASHPRDSHVAPNIARDHHRLAMLIQKIMTDFSGVITIVSRRAHDNSNVYRMWPANEPDPLANEVARGDGV